MPYQVSYKLNYLSFQQIIHGIRNYVNFQILDEIVRLITNKLQENRKFAKIKRASLERVISFFFLFYPAFTIQVESMKLREIGKNEHKTLFVHGKKNLHMFKQK